MKLGIFSVMDYHPSVQGSQADFYQQMIDYAVLADEHDLDSFWLAEHHFSDYGLCPTPAVLLSNIAAQTKQIKLGPAVKVLPFHDPVKVAEEYAVLDILAKGRIELGVGKGYLADEYQGHNIEPQDAQQRFIESLDIVQSLWKSDEPISYQGKYFKLENPIKLNTKPLQAGGPPLSFAVLRPEGFYKVGELGHSIMGIPYLMDDLASLKPAMEHYHQGLTQGDHNIADFNSTMGMHIHIAQTTEQAIQQARPYIERYCQTRAVGNTRSFEQLMEKKLILVGSPQDVSEQLNYIKAQGVTRVLALMDFGGMPFKLVKSSLELLAEL